GMLSDPNAVTATNKRWLTELRSAATPIGREVELLLAGNSREIEALFAGLAEKQVDALIVQGSPVFPGFRAQLSNAAARYAVPVMYFSRTFTEAGGLMSYGAFAEDHFRLVGVYVG